MSAPAEDPVAVAEVKRNSAGPSANRIFLTHSKKAHHAILIDGMVSLN